jgi:NAD(P)-dependent dehydrogenase (short-subunit alcohol dehydrogenase family)
MRSLLIYAIGINLAFAALLLNRGCNVVFADIALRPEAQVVIEQHSGMSRSGVAVFQKCDVTKWRDLQRAFDRANIEFGGIDIVCPGAGIYEPPFSNFWNPPSTEKSSDDIDGGRYKVLDVNITHPIRMTQMAIEHFRKLNKNGSIVHLSSIAGQQSTLVTPMYVATKFAISGFVRSLARLEKMFGIRVIAVAPGVVKTPLWVEHP